MRYLLQKTQYSCVPVGIVNIFKFFGIKFTKKDVGWISEYLATNPRAGTAKERLEQFLSKFFLFKKVIDYSENNRKTQLNNIKKCLNDGGCVAMVYLDDYRDWHFSVITSKSGRKYSILNWYDKKTDKYQYLEATERLLGSILSRKGRDTSTLYLIENLTERR